MADDVRDEELLAPVPGAARDGVSGSARAGLFVTFEGGDGAGKTTQIALAQAWLEEQGHAVVTTREPGGTELGVAIRQLILHGDHVAPRAEALLYAADRAHHVETLVRPALERGDVILQDRYIDSSIAYQGAGRALDAFVVRKAQKSYGMGRQVEGPGVDGRRVVVLEDTSTTGGSALTAVEGVRNAGGDVQAVAVIVDRATGAAERVAEEAGVPYLYAFGKDELGLD